MNIHQKGRKCSSENMKQHWVKT